MTGVLLAVAAGACSSGSTPSDPSEATAPPEEISEFLEFPATDTGVLRSWSFPSEQRALVQADPEKGTIDFELLACRWEWPGRFVYDIEWDPPEDLDLPATVPLQLVRFQGDMGSGVFVEAILVEPGEFTVVVTEEQVATLRAPEAETESEEPLTWSASRSDALRGVGTVCTLRAELDHPVEVTNDGVEVEQAGRKPTVTAPAGTVEQLLALIDPEDPDDPLLPLAALFLDPTWPEIDRLWIAPTAAMESIQIEVTGTCITIRTEYVAATISQKRNCANGSATENGSEPVVGIEDPAWQIRVVGSEVGIEELIGRLAVVPFQ